MGWKKKTLCNLGCAEKAGWDREKGLPGKAPPPSSPAPSWLWFPEAGGMWLVEGEGGSCPGLQVPGIPPQSSPHISSPIYKAQGAKESVWPRQLSLEAQRREPKLEGRLSHPPMPAPGAAASQIPLHLPCGPGHAIRAKEGKLNVESTLGVGGVHAPGAPHTLNSSASLSLAVLSPCKLLPALSTPETVDF